MIKAVNPCEGCPKYRKDYHLGYPEGNYHRDCLISECVRRERFEATIKGLSEGWWGAVDELRNRANALKCMKHSLDNGYAGKLDVIANEWELELETAGIERPVNEPSG